MSRHFLLSPAKASGERAGLLMGGSGQFDMARRLRAGESLPLSEIFTFLSGLYFRGKIAYARRFADPARYEGGVHIITPHRGLLRSDTLVDLDELRAFADVPIDCADPRYTGPLVTRMEELLASSEPDIDVVLLGSIAGGKYVDCLLPVCGERLVFPAEFVGRGDMSRGGLLLRAAASGSELEYISVAGAIRRGKRPPRLKPLN